MNKFFFKPKKIKTLNDNLRILGEPTLRKYKRLAGGKFVVHNRGKRIIKKFIKYEKENENAVKKGEIEEGNRPEHQDGNDTRKAAETGSSDCNENGGKV